MPPWLWVWLGGYLLATMPQEISLLHFTIVTYFGHKSVLSRIPLHGLVTVEPFSLIFVASHDPSISLRVTIRSDQTARLYPVGWRRARIAVFRPLPALWRRDSAAAEAILLHEVAHRRQGDQLIVGLGSPFVMLMRIWVPAYLLLVFVPVTVYLAVGGSTLAPFVIIPSITQAVAIPGVIFLPVTALWLAELGADQMAARALGPGAVRQALRATAGSRVSVLARALALLSHPPRRLRLRLAAASPAGAAGLVAAWPAALVAWLVVLPFALAVPVLLLFAYRPA